MEKTRSSKLLYQGNIIKVYKDQVSVNEREAIREVVRHPGGVGILIVINQQVLLVKQYRYAVGEEVLEIPAGKREADEEWRLCAKREMEEETGYTCDKLVNFASFYTSPGIFDEILYLYEAINPYKVEHPLSMDEDEDIEVCWIPLTKIKDMLDRMEFKDAKTIIALQYALAKEN